MSESYVLKMAWIVGLMAIWNSLQQLTVGGTLFSVFVEALWFAIVVSFTIAACLVRFNGSPDV